MAHTEFLSTWLCYARWQMSLGRMPTDLTAECSKTANWPSSRVEVFPRKEMAMARAMKDKDRVVGTGDEDKTDTAGTVSGGLAGGALGGVAGGALAGAAAGGLTGPA